MADEWGWVGALDEDRMEGGGRRGAEVMRVARAMDPLCCVPLGMPDGRVGT